jgi:6-phosphogluconolactonase (cycloisomerase 2 family)
VTNETVDTTYEFSIDASTGLPTLIGSTPPINGAARGAALHPSGDFLCVSDAFNNNIVVYRIDSALGALTPIATGPFSTCPIPFSMTFDSSGKFAYVACKGGGVSAYAIDVSTGSLTPLSGSPFPAGTAPFSVATTTKIQ